MTVPASPARRSPAKSVHPAVRPSRVRTAPPVLVRQVRNGIEESVHRGDIVEVDAAGRLIRQLGDADRVVSLRSTVKPFGVLALIEAGGIEAFDLEPAEIAILASSHSGEDVHVRTLQGIYRRTGVSQSLLVKPLSISGRGVTRQLREVDAAEKRYGRAHQSRTALISQRRCSCSRFRDVALQFLEMLWRDSHCAIVPSTRSPNC